jgi:hypothetical protein
MRERLPWYVKGSLGGEEMMQVAAHLTTCDACRLELAATVHLSLEVETLFDRIPAPPADLWNRVTKETHGRPLGSLNVGSFLLGFSMGASWKRSDLPIRGDLRVMGQRMRLFDTDKRRRTGGTHE